VVDGESSPAVLRFRANGSDLFALMSIVEWAGRHRAARNVCCMGGITPATRDVWGAKAADWAEFQEPTWRPAYAAVMARADVSVGKKLLDVGCGAGAALTVARELGAEIYGLDASRGLVTVARTRLPGARIEVGNMMDLPFEDETFEVVTGFNSFQFADDVVAALREARRVCKKRGLVAMLVWGPRQDCDLLNTILPAIFALLPPTGSDDGPEFSEPGVMEDTMRGAGLSPTVSGDFDCEFTYRDSQSAWRAISSAPPFRRASEAVGEEAVKKTLSAALAPFMRADGAVTHKNRLRWVLATR
jgi:SAM-dependent methyltransferase